MTDDTISAGDGSPQLDLDAIKRRPAKSGGWAFDAVQETVSLSRKERDGLLALVRRLQQENEDLRYERDAWRAAAAVLAKVDPEKTTVSRTGTVVGQGYP